MKLNELQKELDTLYIEQDILEEKLMQREEALLGEDPEWSALMVLWDEVNERIAAVTKAIDD